MLTKTCEQKEISLTSRSLAVFFVQTVLPLTHQNESSPELSLLLQGAKYSSFGRDVCFMTAARGVTPGVLSCFEQPRSWPGELGRQE